MDTLYIQKVLFPSPPPPSPPEIGTVYPELKKQRTSVSVITQKVLQCVSLSADFSPFNHWDQ